MNDDFDNWLAGREREEPVDDGCMLRPGQRIGAYRIVRQLGVGGMGQVYEAEHVALGVRRALKVFSTESEHSEFLRKRFVAEGRILADLQHPRIVRVYDLVVDEDSGMAYFEMDLVLSPDGQPRTLADELQDGVDEEKIVGWFKDICEGLAYIHSQGVVHRDISLDNILIARDGRAVITDFGIAKIIDDSYRKKIDVTVTMVYKDGSEVRIGKERYMAPELKKPNGRASFATDAWALGVLLFRMLSGSWYDVGTRLEDWHADLKYDWHPVLSQLFNPEPKNRLGNGGIAAFPTLLAAKTKTAPVRRLNRMLWCGIVIMLIGAGVIAAYFIKSYEEMNAHVLGGDILSCDLGLSLGKNRGDAKIVKAQNVYDAAQRKIGDLEKRLKCEEELEYEYVADERTGINTVTIVDARKSKGNCKVDGDYVIPSEINGCRVTRIGDSAFYGCDGLTSVTIPSCVTSIGDAAFSYCAGLKRVLIPNGVTSIGTNAFSCCSRLRSVAIPSSVTNIGDGAFSDCAASIDFSVAENNPKYKSLGGLLLTKDDNTLVAVLSRIEHLVIPNGVISVAPEIFLSEERLYLKSITIPASVTNLQERLFVCCMMLESFFVSDDNPIYKSVSGLLLTRDGKSLVAIPQRIESVTIPEGVTNIGCNDFSFKYRLKRVVIPASVTNIDNKAFSDCVALIDFSVAENNPNYQSLAGLLLTKDGKTLLQGVGGDVDIPSGVMCIEDMAFARCRGLKSVKIPDSVIRVGKRAFPITGLKMVYAEPGDVDRVKKLFVDSGHDIANIEFMEGKADEKCWIQM